MKRHDKTAICNKLNDLKFYTEKYEINIRNNL